MRHLASVYRVEARIGLLNQAQYRAAVIFTILGFLIEPIVYLVVWSTVAEQSGSIGGYTADDFVAYYIVWTLVRNMNLAFTPYAWDWLIVRGRLSERLLEPVNFYHRILAGFMGMKVVWIVAWIPIAAFLVLVFRPSFTPSLLEVAAFAVAIWGGYFVRAAILYLLGLITFWTTRASALFETVVAAELILSGRLVPLAVMPEWVERIGNWLPFKWTFQFPIEVFIGRLSTAEILWGVAAQAGWFAALTAAVMLTWKRGVRRFTAVGT